MGVVRVYQINEDVGDERELKVLEDIIKRYHIFRLADVYEQEVVEESSNIDGIHQNVEVAEDDD